MSWYDFLMKDADLEARSQEPEVRQEPKEEEFDCSFADNLSFAQLFNNRYSYNSLSSVYAACEKIANSLASMPLRVVQQSMDGHQEVLTTHPYQKIFRDRGVQTMSMYMTMKNAILDTLKRGNGYILINRAQTGDITSFRYMDASTVSIMYNEQKDSLYYLAPNYVKGKIMPADIIHLIKNTKSNGIEGQSVLNYAHSVCDLAKAAEDAAAEFFASGCNINGVLSAGPGTVINAKQREELKQSWTIKGSKTSIQVLPANVQYHAIGVDSARAQLLESRAFQIQEICRFFDIPPQLLYSGDKMTYSSLETINLIFLTHTLMPWIKMIETEFSRKLFPENLEMCIDVDESEFLLRCDKNTASNYYSKLVTSGIMTVNECRSELGLKRIEDENADKLHIAYSDISQNTIGNETENAQEPENETDEKTQEEKPKQRKTRAKKIDK